MINNIFERVFPRPKIYGLYRKIFYLFLFLSKLLLKMSEAKKNRDALGGTVRKRKREGEKEEENDIVWDRYSLMAW